MMSSNTTKAIADNLSDLIADSGKTLKELSREIGVSPANLSKYQNDIAEAGINNIVKIAEYFHVSIDWLVGCSTVRSPSMSIRKMCSYTGLSEMAINNFHAWTAPDLEIGPSYLIFLNQLLESSEFELFINNIFQFFYSVAAEQLLNSFPEGCQQNIQLILKKITRGNTYIASPILREKLTEYGEFLWNTKHDAYTLDTPDVYEHHVTRALDTLLSTQRTVAQTQATSMLSDNLDNILREINDGKIDASEEDFIDEKLKQVLQELWP